MNKKIVSLVLLIVSIIGITYYIIQSNVHILGISTRVEENDGQVEVWVKE